VIVQKRPHKTMLREQPPRGPVQLSQDLIFRGGISRAADGRSFPKTGRAELRHRVVFVLGSVSSPLKVELSSTVGCIYAARWRQLGERSGFWV
jgi:hypothetical protein